MPKKQECQGPAIHIISEGKIKFDYIKGNNYRVIHVDGIHGGVGPNQNIFIALWNERWPIPKQSVFSIGTDGVLGAEIHEERISRDAIVREVEAGLILDYATAKKIRDWLNKNIDLIEKVGQGKKDVQEEKE